MILREINFDLARETTLDLVRGPSPAVGAGGADGDALVEFTFPTTSNTTSFAFPRAVLSLKPAGSMRYLVESPNPSREAFLSKLGWKSGQIVATELFHTRRIRFVDPATRLPQGRVHEVEAGSLAGEDHGDGGPDGAEGRDGVILPPGGGLAAMVTVADCMPIWIFDTHSGCYGVLHSGWKGTGILASALRGLALRHGSPASALSVILGPAIGACCYEVPPERAAAFELEFGPASVDRSGPQPRIDIRAANLALARSLGVGALLSVDACTSCQPSLGSFRREGSAAFTRMAALCLPG